MQNNCVFTGNKYILRADFSALFVLSGRCFITSDLAVVVKEKHIIIICLISTKNKSVICVIAKIFKNT